MVVPDALIEEEHVPVARGKDDDRRAVEQAEDQTHAADRDGKYDHLEHGFAEDGEAVDEREGALGVVAVQGVGVDEGALGEGVDGDENAKGDAECGE